MIRIGHVQLPDPVARTAKGDKIELEFRSLTGEQKDELAKFFKDDAHGMHLSWDYKDSNGPQRANFTEPSLVFVQFAMNAWDVTLPLRIM